MPRVYRRGLVGLGQAAACQDARDPPLERGHHGLEVPLGRRACWVKPQRPGRILRIHPIQHEGMHVHVEVQGRHESLDDHHGTTTTARHNAWSQARAYRTRGGRLTTHWRTGTSGNT
jgi:hypothetical protein